MYDNILVTLDATSTDRTIIDHVKPLAKMMHSRVALLHVADGWAARKFGNDAVSREVDDDKKYLDTIRAEFEREGIATRCDLAYGDPATEIVKWVREKGCDLIAMSTHGHRFLGDLVFGVTASKVQHSVEVPVLLLKARDTK